MFKTIAENVFAEIVEKKSKFIANVYYVESKEEADIIISSVKKKYHDARHNCYAYRIYNENGIIEKSSDDGEPSGTAGAPILNILSKNDLYNVLIIVTRYFGGILLGTGGLVRAYSNAAGNAILNAKIIEKNMYHLYEIELEYEDLKSFQNFAQKNNINIKKEEYLEKIKLEIAIKNNDILDKIKEINVKNIKYVTDKYI